jgi:hypothetical protein
MVALIFATRNSEVDGFGGGNNTDGAPLTIFLYLRFLLYVPCNKFAYYFAVPMTHRLPFFYTCVVLDIDFLCTV